MISGNIHTLNYFYVACFKWLQRSRMACIPIYPPRGLEILREHIRLARARCEVQDMAAPLTYIWFYQRVRNGGPWDYKQKNRLWADFGNFHFGAVGYAACIPAEILHMAAGAAQWKAGTSRKEWEISCKAHRSAMTRLISSG